MIKTFIYDMLMKNFQQVDLKADGNSNIVRQEGKCEILQIKEAISCNKDFIYVHLCTHAC